MPWEAEALEILIWIGTGLSLLGLCGLVWSIVRVMRARKTTKDDDALRAAVQSVLPYNLGALFVSVIGLMMVVVGVFLS